MLESVRQGLIFRKLEAGIPNPPRHRNLHLCFLESTWRAVPDLRLELIEGPLVDPASPKVADYWRASGIQTGNWVPPGLSPPARRIDFEGASLEEFRDGRICQMRVVYDVAAIMRQLGVLPNAGSMGERAIIGWANLQTQLRRR